MPEEAAKNVASTYFEAWKANDFATMRSLVADDVGFEGPLATLEGAEEYMEGIRGLSRVVSEIVIRKVFVDGKIAALRVAFDARTRPVELGLRRICPPRTSVNRAQRKGLGR